MIQIVRTRNDVMRKGQKGWNGEQARNNSRL